MVGKWRRFNSLHDSASQMTNILTCWLHILLSVRQNTHTDGSMKSGFLGTWLMPCIDGSLCIRSSLMRLIFHSSRFFFPLFFFFKSTQFSMAFEILNATGTPEWLFCCVVVLFCFFVRIRSSIRSECGDTRNRNRLWLWPYIVFDGESKKGPNK